MKNSEKIEELLRHEYPDYTKDLAEYVEDIYFNSNVEFDSDEIVDAIHKDFWEKIKPLKSLSDHLRGKVYRQHGELEKQRIEKIIIKSWLTEVSDYEGKLTCMKKSELSDLYQEKILGRKPDRSGPEYADQAQYDKSFKEMAWEDFDFDAVIEVLLDERKSFKYHRPILFEALAGWVIAPHQPYVRENAIRLMTRYAVEKNEMHGIKTAHVDSVMALDTVTRMLRLGEGFFEQVYYPIGGMKAFSTITEPDLYAKELLSNHRKSIETLVKFLEIAYFHNSHNQKSGKYNPASLNLCFEVIETRNNEAQKWNNSHPQDDNCLELYLGKKSLEKALSERRETIPLLYAAQCVPIDKGYTLLDRFLDPRISHKFNRETIKCWLSYAAFIRNEIVDSLSSKHLSAIHRMKSLEQVRPSPVPIPELTKWEQNIIQETTLKAVYKNK